MKNDGRTHCRIAVALALYKMNNLSVFQWKNIGKRRVTHMGNAVAFANAQQMNFSMFFALKTISDTLSQCPCLRTA